jgi:hypothetical protein
VIEHLAEVTLLALRTALEAEGRRLDERLLAAFASMTLENAKSTTFIGAETRQVFVDPVPSRTEHEITSQLG